ncbi:unnamed protein product, partial [Scytosiphon promiscuus]
MASGGAMDAATRLVSRPARLLFPLLAFLCCASAASMSPSPMSFLDTSASAQAATSAPSVLAVPAKAGEAADDYSGNDSAAAAAPASSAEESGGSSSLILLAIVCGSVVAAGVGVVLLCCLWRSRAKRRGAYGDKAERNIGGGASSSTTTTLGPGRRWGRRVRGQEGAAGGDGRRHAEQRGVGGVGPPISNPSSACHSRSASLALMAAPFEGSSAWHAAADEEEGLDFDLGLPSGVGGGVSGGGGGVGGRQNSDTIASRYANPLYAVNVTKTSMERGSAAVGEGTAPAPAATASPSAAGDDFEEEHDKDDAEKALGRGGFYPVDGGGDDRDGDEYRNT